jgi:hypothetical protein
MSHSTSHCSCTLRLSALLCRSPEWSQIHTKACISSSSSSSVVGSWSSCLVTASACHREILRQRRRRRRRSSRDGPKRQQRRELFRRPVASPHVPSRPSPVRTTCSPLAVREISSHPRTYLMSPSRPAGHCSAVCFLQCGADTGSRLFVPGLNLLGAALCFPRQLIALASREPRTEQRFTRTGRTRRQRQPFIITSKNINALQREHGTHFIAWSLIYLDR